MKRGLTIAAGMFGESSLSTEASYPSNRHWNHNIKTISRTETFLFESFDKLLRSNTVIKPISSQTPQGLGQAYRQKKATLATAILAEKSASLA